MENTERFMNSYTTMQQGVERRAPAAGTQWTQVTALRLLSIFCLAFWFGQFAAGQEMGCTPTVRYLQTFRWPVPAERSLLPKQVVMRGNIALSGDDRLLIYETGTTTVTFPYSGEPKAEFKVVSGKKEVLRVALTEIPELRSDHVFAEGLRPTFVAELCRINGEKIVLASSGSGATGEGQFFIAFVKTNTGYRYFDLPVAKQGKLEVSTKEPGSFKLWSAVDSERIGSASPKHYETGVYKLDDDGFHLVSTSRTTRKYAPDDFVNRPIRLKDEAFQK